MSASHRSSCGHPRLATVVIALVFFVALAVSSTAAQPSSTKYVLARQSPACGDFSREPVVVDSGSCSRLEYFSNFVITPGTGEGKYNIGTNCTANCSSCQTTRSENSFGSCLRLNPNLFFSVVRLESNANATFYSNNSLCATSPFVQQTKLPIGVCTFIPSTGRYYLPVVVDTRDVPQLGAGYGYGYGGDCLQPDCLLCLAYGYSTGPYCIAFNSASMQVGTRMPHHDDPSDGLAAWEWGLIIGGGVGGGILVLACLVLGAVLMKRRRSGHYEAINP